MKKILKKEVIIAFIIGIILASSIAVYAYSYAAKDVSYTKPGTTTAINVETALNDLYNKQLSSLGELLWVNPNLGTPFEAQTISLDLSEYSKVLIVGEYVCYTYTDIKYYGCVIINKGTTGNLKTLYGGTDCGTRNITVNANNIIFDEGRNEASGTTVQNNHSIPAYVIGIK